MLRSKQKLPSHDSDATTSLDPRILAIVRTYNAAEVPAVCSKCGGVGSVRGRAQSFWGEFFLASTGPVVCDECGGRGTVWFAP